MPINRCPSHGPSARPQKQSGVMLLALLIALTILGLVVTRTADLWSTTMAREREQELLFVGEQYRKAVERYYYATPGANKALPLSIDELLQDDRFPTPQRHLRKPYPDPMGGEAWGVLRQGSRIIGVYSQSELNPMKKSGFDTRYAEFSAATSYREWRFVFKQPLANAAGNARGVPLSPFPSAVAPAKRTILPSPVTR
jgi:type II secretory pathway pseudopilin PulG